MVEQHPKRAYLASVGALHPHPEAVQAEPFRNRRFFDPLDKVQVKYEMLRAHGVDGRSVVSAAAGFGCSRETFYQALHDFEERGVLGLRDGKRGRRGPLKLTPELIAWVRALAREQPLLSGRDIAQRLAAEHSVEVHRRTIERLLAPPPKKTAEAGAHGEQPEHRNGAPKPGALLFPAAGGSAHGEQPEHRNGESKPGALLFPAAGGSAHGEQPERRNGAPKPGALLFPAAGGSAQARYEALRAYILPPDERSRTTPLRFELCRFQRFGLLGLLDDDPVGAAWRTSQSDDFAVELIPVATADASQRAARLYAFLVQLLNVTPGDQHAPHRPLCPSLDRYAGEGGDDPEPLAALAQYVEAHGFTTTPALTYVDEGFSGSLLERPALDQLRDHAREGRFDVLVVLRPDRLARKYAYQVPLLEELKRAGIAVHFCERPIGDSPDDQLLLQIQGAVAEYDRAKILERSRRGRLYRARMGELSRAPYGYHYVEISWPRTLTRSFKGCSGGSRCWLPCVTERARARARA